MKIAVHVALKKQQNISLISAITVAVIEYYNLIIK